MTIVGATSGGTTIPISHIKVPNIKVPSGVFCVLMPGQRGDADDLHRRHQKLPAG